MALVTVFVFIGLGIGFLTTGLLMIHAIKNNFTEFYLKVGCILWAATMLLAVPMFLRGINWFLQIQSANYSDAYNSHIAESNAIYCILTTIFPVCAQMASLIFGLYKNKDPKPTKLTQSYDPMKDLPRGSSGEQADDDSDDTSNESDSNMTQSYFDPPIANYKFNYYTPQRDNVVQPGTGGKGEFKIIRRIKRNSENSRHNSILTSNSAMNRPSENSAIGFHQMLVVPSTETLSPRGHSRKSSSDAQDSIRDDLSSYDRRGSKNSI